MIPMPKINHLKRVDDMLDKNLSAAIQTIIAGLKATTPEGDPDWKTRVTCAKCLIDKRIADVQKPMQLNAEIRIVIDKQDEGA